jgi:hydroxymethylglutaryl-CoA lyase
MSSVRDIYPLSRVSLREVGLRDGLQLVKSFPSTEAKKRWVRDEYAAGVRHFEVGSFLPAKTFPQFADVREMVETVATLPGAHGVVLALNERGVNEALASGVAEIASVVSATEEHSQANANRSREAAIANVKRLCELRDAGAHRPIVHAAISMALGCSISGEVDPNEVLRLVEKCFEVGVDVVGIADTVGYAGPKQVGDLTWAAVRLAGSKPICVHLTTPAAWGSRMPPPLSMPARGFSTDRLAGSAAVRSRRAPLAMWCSRTWCSCARAKDLQPASTSTD